MPLAVPDRRLVGRLLLAVGALGAVTSIAGAAVGFGFLGGLQSTLDSSVGVTADALDALQASVELGSETFEAVERVLDETESTTRGLGVALQGTETAMTGIARLSDDEVADSVSAVSRSLPALIDAAAVIDRTLGGLNSVPFGPDYDPDEPFDESLREVQRELAELPQALRRQADLIRDGRDDLREVRRGTTRLADDLGTLNATLASAADVLAEYETTTTNARDVVAASSEGLRHDLLLGRAIVVVLGLVLLASQVVPLGLGWFLLHPEAGTAFLTAAGGDTASGP